MKLVITKERQTNEKRVAASPETVQKFKNLGITVVVEKGAGILASMTDRDYRKAGAKIASTAEIALKNADIVLKVQRPTAMELKQIPAGAKLICLCAPHQNRKFIQTCADHNIDLFAMELIPRITRAQSMDVLSSQTNLAGYKAVLEATSIFDRALPMMMTAAGTILPAKIFVMGAGVAGLQAIATAKRLGAIVFATDVRPASKEQVESLGGRFVMVASEETLETSGGYAKEASASYRKKQATLIKETIKDMDIVICTALIPGKPAPILVTETMVKSMKTGSVIVDLAAEQGGNCALSEPGKITQTHGVKIIAHRNMPARLATDSSRLYANNLLNFVKLLLDKSGQAFSIDPEDEIVSGTALTRAGQIVHKDFQ